MSLIKYNYTARRLVVPEKGVPYMDQQYKPKKGVVEGINLDDAMGKLKRGEVKIDPKMQIRSVSPGPNGFVVYLVDKSPSAKKERPQPKRSSRK